MTAPRSFLDALASPRGVAVIGASDDRSRPGGRVIEYLLQYAFTGAIYPVNPKRESVQGLPAFPRVSEIPGQVDVAVIVVPAEAVLSAVEECAAKGVSLVVIGSAGFSESGPQGEELQVQLTERARELGVRVIGPNTNGLIDCRSGLTATFAVALQDVNLVLENGPTAIVSQSGALGGALFSLAYRAGLPAGLLVNTGNEIDVTLEETLEALVAPDSSASVVLAYVEGVSDAVRLTNAARTAAASGKSIALLKVGTSPSGADAAAAHTARLAGEDRVYDGVLAQLGVARAHGIQHLIDVGRVLAVHGSDFGMRATIASLSGGVGIILVDLVESTRLQLARWDDDARAEVAEWLPAFLSTANPIDLGGRPFWDTELLKNILAAIDSNPVSDFSILAITNFEKQQEAILTVLRELVPQLSKPLFVVWVGAPDGVQLRLARMGIVCFSDPAHCVAAISSVATLSPGTIISRPESVNNAERSEAVAGLLATTKPGEALPPALAMRLLQTYGVPVVEEVAIATVGELDGAAIPVPAVVKLTAPSLAHKSDVGGVVKDLESPEAVFSTVRELFALAERLGVADSRVIVQRQVAAGSELLLGMKADPVFGPVLTLGLGGVLAEALDDVVVRLPELSEMDVRLMLAELRHQELLHGFRHLPPVEADAIAPCVLAFARLVRDVGHEFAAIDLNPVIVSQDGSVTVVDALAVRAQ